MTQEEIIVLARESGMELYGLGKDRAKFVHYLIAFAKLVAAKEREALAQEQEPVALPCCGYTNPEAIKWNTHNQVVQCHNCGQVYTPQRQPLTQEQRDAIVRPAVPNDWNDYEVIDAVEAAHGIKE